MFKNYLKVTLRFLSKNMIFVGINIIGLALAIAICIVAYFNTKRNIDWDSGHTNYNNIYKISITHEIKERQQDYGITPYKLAGLIKKDIPAIDEVSRFNYKVSPVKYKRKIFNQQIAYVDPNFTDVFTLEIINGDLNSLKKSGSILINDELASIYFGDGNPIGKVVSIFNDESKEYTFVVGGVYKRFPLNSSFSFEAVTQIVNMEEMEGIESDSWDYWIGATFLMVRDKMQINNIQELLQQYIPAQNAALDDFQISEFFIESMEVAHKQHNRRSNYIQSSFPPPAVIAPMIMAILILILACFNFTNTAIAFAGKRLKEIGIRKVFGGQRKHIIVQFLCENFIISICAVLVGLFFSTYLLEGYSKMWEETGMNFIFEWNFTLLVFLIALVFLTTILAGSYPAFFVSKFNPIKIFKDKLKLGSKNRLSKVLLGFQLVISVISLVSGVMFAQNAIYQDKLDLGYNMRDILIVEAPGTNEYIPMAQAAKENSKILSFSGTSDHVGYGAVKRNLDYREQSHEVNTLHIGHNYLETLEISLQQGRDFELDLKATDLQENSIIVNKKLIDDFELTDPIGVTLYMNDTVPLRIIGVVNDFHLYGFWATLKPLAFVLAKEKDCHRIIVRANHQDLTTINDEMKKAWKEFIPNFPYKSQYQEDVFFTQAKLLNQNLRIMYAFLALVAICLSAIGLYTLVSLNVLGRNKEIGIRKVNGATIATIMKLINKPFMILTIISLVLGLYGGYYTCNMFMGSIWVRHTTGNFWSFFIPAIIILSIYTLTVIWKTYKAASQNPADMLRYE
ncbi:MAG: ABC transporter permease [Bacteroidales bacterium]|nr:ABC transporter permease [Bacteroidales bacterium]